MRENKKPNPPNTAEGPVTKEPEQSPSLPSGVVEAMKALEGCSALLFIQIGQLCFFKERMESMGEPNEPGTMLGTVNFMLKEARSQFKEINPVIAKLRSLSQAPATREANQGMLEVVDFLEFVANTFEGKSLGNRARNVLAALSRPNGEAGAAPRDGEKEKE